MDLGWKLLIPLSLGWLLVLAAIRISRDEGVGPVIATTAGVLLAALLLSAAVSVGKRRRELAGPIDGAFD
jgi:NADH-quinone oxidoreductase subunit H